jgi:hypothetical protein
MRHEPAAADIDGDARNEVLVCKSGGKVAALRFSSALGPSAHRPESPRLAWEIDGSGLLTSLPAPYPTPLIADVDGNGRPEYVAGLAAFKPPGAQGDADGGKTLWEVEVPGGAMNTPVAADVDGDGFCEILLACGDGRLRVFR